MLHQELHLQIYNASDSIALSRAFMALFTCVDIPAGAI